MKGNDNRCAWLEGPTAVCTAPAEAAYPWRLILLGAPGVGKGTQAELLDQRLSACHLSTGEVFRAAAGRSSCEQTPAMRAALDYMRRGALVPDATVWEMVRERSGCLRCRGGLPSRRVPPHPGPGRIPRGTDGKPASVTRCRAELRAALTRNC